MKELITIQSKLKAPKGQFNHFGKYKYRSCEDIMEAVKPLLAETGCTLTVSDSIEMIGTRFYVRAAATLTNPEGQTETATAYAREAESRQGMDAAQLTGATSSYARKYALNGLFCIDDTKDADATNDHGAGENVKKPAPKPQQMSFEPPSHVSDEEEMLALAVQELRAAQSRARIGQIHKNYSPLHANPRYNEALKAACEKFPA